MGRKRKQTNYRQYYKDYYGIEFGSDMAIHHIDFDRSNNSIDNLIMLPIGLHSKYHLCINALGGVDGELSIDGKIDLHGNASKASALHNLADVLNEIDKWRIVKENDDMRVFFRGQNNG